MKSFHYTADQLSSFQGSKIGKKYIIEYNQGLNTLFDSTSLFRAPIIFKNNDDSIRAIEFPFPKNEKGNDKKKARISKELKNKYNKEVKIIKSKKQTLQKDISTKLLSSFQVKWLSKENLYINQNDEASLICWGVQSRYIEHLMIIKKQSNSIVDDNGDNSLGDNVLDEGSDQLTPIQFLTAFVLFTLTIALIIMLW